ncbi:carboxypeptidase N subunit 2 isoform X2 [Parasteatoda tepidariorum]|uniref:carboxypeptidase N subunit 2 isoform X2 n=1 Tax=Parasteatoda tepidariorum TaxID=114398 RepID=UPI001C72094E|nr:leucine-rich repeat neuronal protein 3 isoform X2 [Parasteatoda tepidariorum]
MAIDLLKAYSTVKTLSMNKFLIICILWTCAAITEGSCPAWDKDSPCVCGETKTGIEVRCSGVSGSYRVMAALAELQTDVPWELQLSSLTINELPPTVSSVTSLRLNQCNVRRLMKSGSTEWPNLSEIVFESVRFQESLWPQLRGARVLKFIKISDVILSNLGRDFRDSLPAGIEYVELRKTSTSKIESGCMSHLSNLRYVFITDMPLTHFPRNALPNEMNQLHTFVLGNTQIENLEPNFFSGMPKLQVLMLNGNQFSTLDESLFTPLQSHLNHLLAERNPLQCECSMLWLKTFQKKRSINVFATCYDEHTEQIKEILDLQDEIYCS